jgi:hypothetical protein
MQFISSQGSVEEAEKYGFRFGAKGTHTSRTIMFDELRALFAAVPPTASRREYATAIVDGNCLGKSTTATRRLSNQRLTELYGLDPDVPVFRALRRLWELDETGQRLLALECALARDPLLAATAKAVHDLPPEAEFQRDTMRESLRQFVGGRLNDAILDKVVRNAASSWGQAGYLVGRTFKKRRAVRPTPPAVAFALYLARAAGFRGAQLFTSGWISILDCSPNRARELALDAKRRGLVDLRMAGDVVDITFERLERAA